VALLLIPFVILRMIVVNSRLPVVQ
jgi:hypothetical protein